MTTLTTDTRNIYTRSGTALVSLAYASLDATAQGYFNNKCAVMSQCSSLVVSDQLIVNTGANLVNYLRGQSLYADGLLFRSRTDTTSTLTNILGDLVDSRPVVVNAPTRHYGDAPIAPGNQGYGAYATTYASRESVIYVGGNDGMLHAFDALTGNELWAYVPRIVLSRMYALADVSYPTQHQYYVDGSPEVADVLSTTDGLWHTILIGGLAGGGRGYFAFDITNPTSPTLLWEFCSDSTVCSVSDSNLGLSFGNPVVTKRGYDGRWVVLVTSGYNNVSPGDGQGHLYELDPFTGQILGQVATGVGSTTTPSGLSTITAAVVNPDTNNTALAVYGGDLQGNLWRFNLSGASPTVSTMATLIDAASKPQPITVRPEVGQVNGHQMVYVGTGRLLGVSDLQDPATLAPAGNWSYVSSEYALLDNGTNLGNPRASSAMVKQTFSTFSATQRAISSNPVSIPTNIGWMVDFPTTGERVVVNAQLLLGVLVVTTNIPNVNACSAGGDSWQYQFDYTSGSSIVGTPNAIVGTETVGSLTVGTTIVELPNGSFKIINKHSDGSNVVNGLNSNVSSGTARRVGWRYVTQ